MPKSACVLISGRGSNLGALIQNSSDFKIELVVSNNPEAKGLLLAQESGIPTKAFNRAGYSSVKDLKLALFDFLERTDFDYYLLAGFMLLVPEDFTVKKFGKILNIHPSLLPSFPGLDTHKRALEHYKKCRTEESKMHGCSVHFVDGGLDSGPLIAQAELEIHEDDSEESLAARVLELEHRLYPWVVNNLSSGDIQFTAGNFIFSGKAFNSAEENNFKVVNV